MLKPLIPTTIIPADFNIYERACRDPPFQYVIVRHDLTMYRKTYHSLVNHLSKHKNLQFMVFLQVELDGMLHSYVLGIFYFSI